MPESWWSPQYVPIIYNRTVYVYNYVSPSYAPKACYNWGPPINYLTKVTKINIIEVDQRYKDLRLVHLRNVMPPAYLMSRHPGWQEVWPAAAANREMQVRAVTCHGRVPGNLNRPDAILVPLSLNQKLAETSRPKGLDGTGYLRPSRKSGLPTRSGSSPPIVRMSGRARRPRLLKDLQASPLPGRLGPAPPSRGREIE